MKKSYIICAALITAALGCVQNQDETPVFSEGPVEFAVSADGGDITRTVIKNGNQIYWTEGETVGVVDGTDLKQFQTQSAGDVTALLGNVRMENGQLAQESYCAISPLAEGTTYSNGTYSLAIPHVQTATAGTYDPSAAVALGETTREEKHFHFKSAMSFLKISVPDNYDGVINTLTVRSLGSDVFAGNVTVGSAAGSAVISASSVDESYTTVTLKENMTPGNDYFIPVIPGSKSSKIRVIAEGTDGEGKPRTLTQTSNGNLGTLERNKVYTIRLKNWTNPGEEMTGGEHVVLPCGQYVLMYEDGTLDRFNLYITNKDGSIVYDSSNYTNTELAYLMSMDSDSHFHFIAQTTNNSTWKHGKQKYNNNVGSGTQRYQLDGDPNTSQYGLVLTFGQEGDDGNTWYQMAQDYWSTTNSTWQHHRSLSTFLTIESNGREYGWGNSSKAYRVRVFRIGNITQENYNVLD